jgi:acyl-CoA dehydrogenase
VKELRDLTRRFTEREIVPHLAGWEKNGEVPRALHTKAAKAGLLGVAFPEEVGGGGGTMLDSLAVAEEVILAGGSSGVIAALFTLGIALPHIVEAGDPALIDRYVRPTLAGEKIGSLAVTEPDGGSDVAAIRTKAVRTDGGYLLNGAKTYITSGARADFVVTAVRTGPGPASPGLRSVGSAATGSTREGGAEMAPGPRERSERIQQSPGYEGVSLLVVDTDSPGFRVTRRLDKMGWHCSDTAELSYSDVRVPAGNLVGAEGTGFAQIMRHFASERLSMAIQAVATARRCLDLTLAWTKDRETFGRPLASRQVVRHRLAEMARRVDVARTYVQSVATRVANGEPVVSEVAMAKNTAVDACDFVVDAAVQLHGGFGYMRDAEVERHYRDARIMGIGGGTTEIMNEIIARQLGV